MSLSNTAESLLLEIDALENEIYDYKEHISAEITQLTEKLRQLTNDPSSIVLKPIIDDSLSPKLEAELFKRQQYLTEIEKEIEGLKSNISETDSFKTELTTLKKRDLELNTIIKEKQAKLSLQQKNIETLTKRIDLQEEKNRSSAIVESWLINPLATVIFPLLAEAKELFLIARDEWKEAQTLYDAENYNAFFSKAYSALTKASQSWYIVFFGIQFPNDLREVIHHLFKKGIALSTTRLDAVINIVDRIKDGVEVKPQPNYRKELYEQLAHNMQLLRIN